MLGSPPTGQGIGGSRRVPGGNKGITVTLKRIGGALVVGAMLATSLVAFAASPAHAAKIEPSISSLAWWWEDARTEEREVPGVGTVTLETPNPFCPGPGSGLGSPAQACAEGRLPIEVRNGDYETQNKISAVAFDLTLVPVGSKVNKFTATFREAKSGCYDKDGEQDENPEDDTCEQTDPINVGKHQLQACLVTAYFGDGEARQYKEAPKYECTSADPKAKRKEKKSKKDGEGSNFYWTFDLTEYARQWVSEFSAVTGIMLVGVPLGQGNNQDDETWRVVLTGPKFQNGVTTKLDYIPAEEEAFPPLDTGLTDPGSTGTFGSGGTSTFDSGITTDPGTDLGDTGDVGATEESPEPTQSPLVAVGEPPEVEELPGYIWLAVLAGLIGFSLVRSVVMERTAGVRPDGVLARIHRLNAERGGGTAAAAGASTGPLAAMGGALGGVGRKIGQTFGKLNFRKKG